MPPTDGLTHEMMGNDLTEDENTQSQHGHRVSRMCTADKTHRSCGLCADMYTDS